MYGTKKRPRPFFSARDGHVQRSSLTRRAMNLIHALAWMGSFTHPYDAGYMEPPFPSYNQPTSRPPPCHLDQRTFPRNECLMLFLLIPLLPPFPSHSPLTTYLFLHHWSIRPCIDCWYTCGTFLFLLIGMICIMTRLLWIAQRICFGSDVFEVYRIQALFHSRPCSSSDTNWPYFVVRGP